MKRQAAALALSLCTAPLFAQGILESGTWLKRDGSGASLMLSIEALGSARKLTYRIQGQGGRIEPGFEQTLVTQFDGRDADLLSNGKPSGQTMAIKRLDAHHTYTVIKLNGKLVATSRAELSADGKLLTVENEYAELPGGVRAGKQVELWDRK